MRSPNRRPRLRSPCNQQAQCFEVRLTHLIQLSFLYPPESRKHQTKTSGMLTHFQPMFHFYTPWKHQKTYGFHMFLWSMEMDISWKKVNGKLQFLCKQCILLLFGPIFKIPNKKISPIPMYIHFWQFLAIFNHKKSTTVINTYTLTLK